jgi:glycosyltransferase involved in cell wall biosynthesis
VYRYADYAKKSDNFKIYSVFEDPGKSRFKAWLDIICQSIKLARIFSTENIDLIHSHLLYPEVCFAFIAAKLLKKPLVVTIHGLVDFHTLPDAGSFYRKVLFKLLIFILKRAGKVVVVSEEIRQFCARHKIMNAEKVPYGIDTDYFHVRKQQKEKGVLYIGKIDPNKGVYVLLQAYMDVADKIDGDLILVGRGLDEDTRMKRDMGSMKNIEDILMSGRIRFEGEKSRSEIRDLMSNCKVVVLPSFSEGMPLVILEAMACGKLVIASKVGELGRIIKDGENGFLVEPGRVGDLSAALLRTLTDFEKHRKVEGEARLTAEGFTIDKAVNNYLRIYGRFVRNKG